LKNDPIPVYGETTEKPVFSGKRIKRGLYRTDTGILCQSDVNGSYNIYEKHSQMRLGKCLAIANFPLTAMG
jgi:putative transposase